MENSWPDFSDEPISEGEVEDEVLQQRQRERGRRIDDSQVAAELVAMHERMMKEMSEHAADPDDLDDGQFTEEADAPDSPED